MKKMNLLFVLAIIGLVLCPAPVKGQGQKPSLAWQRIMDSTAINFQSIVITKNNDYIISSNNFYGNHNLSSFDNQGKNLWKTSSNIWQMVDMNGVNNFLATNMDNPILTVFGYSGDTIKNVAPPIENLRWTGFLAKDANNYYVCYSDSSGRGRYILTYNNDLQYVKSFPLEINTTSNIIYGLVTINGYIYISESGYGTGGYSNVVSDLYKYDQQGNMIWKKHFLDRTDAHLALSPDENIYIGSFNTNKKNDNPSTKAWLSWGFTKIDTAGNIIWDKSWWDEYPENIPAAAWVHDFKAIPGGGCVISGSATKLGLGDYVDPNNIEPVMVAFSDQGDKIWELRYTELPPKQTGDFLQIAWDSEKYLIASGIVLSQPWSQKLYKYSVDGITAVKQESSEIPSDYSLSQNYPNPFNPSTTINFSVPQSGQVSLKVYDLLGREVATLVNEELNAGTYNAKFDGSQLASGVYVYRLTAPNFTSSKKMMLMK